MDNATIILVHNHALFREGLRHNISVTPGFEIIGEASNGQQAIQAVEQHTPDLLIIEIDLPGISGLEVSWVIKRARPNIGIILLGNSMAGQDVVKAIRAGVAAYLPRTVSWDKLAHAMQRVRDGDYPINDLLLELPDVAAHVLDVFRQTEIERDSSDIYSPLSSRETQVLQLVGAGHTNKEIATSLDISNQTVKNHISSILRKLAVNDRMQAVLYALNRGWIRDQGVEPTSEKLPE